MTDATIGGPGKQLGMAELRAAYSQLARRYDALHGGFGKAPKFPTPHNLQFLLRYWKRTGDQEALAMVETTLQAMRFGFHLHRYRDGQSDISGYLNDYAFLIWGLLETYEANLDVRNLQAALQLNCRLAEHFWDQGTGGYFVSADDSERILVRQKESYDGAIPSGNSVQMLNLLRLGRFTGNPDFEQRASELGRAFSGIIQQSPIAYTHWLSAVDFALGPAQDVTIVGDSGAAATREMLNAVQRVFLPNLVLVFRPTDQPSPDIESIAEFTRYQTSLGVETTAYVCIDQSCQPPTTDLGEMLRLLEGP